MKKICNSKFFTGNDGNNYESIVTVQIKICLYEKNNYLVNGDCNVFCYSFVRNR